MFQQDPSRTEKATPKRRNKARDKGSAPKSADFTKTVILLAGLIAMYIFLKPIGQELMLIFAWFFRTYLSFTPNPENVYSLFVQVSVSLAKMLLPPLLLLAGAAYITLRLQVGDMWAPKVFEFNFGRLFNFVGAIKRMFAGPETLIRLGRSLAQAIIIAIAPYIVLKREFMNMAPLFFQTPENITSYILGTGGTMVKYALAPMLAIGVADLIYTRFSFEEQLKMTKDEVKDERKQAEGDPRIKSKQKQEMMKVMAQRMLEQVPKADVVVTNPTHVAVALRYNVLEAPAPMVVAKGLDHLAEKIKEIAREHGVPIREDQPLARALYKSVEVGEAIPEDFYKAVASILAKLQKFKRGA